MDILSDSQATPRSIASIFQEVKRDDDGRTGPAGDNESKSDDLSNVLEDSDNLKVSPSLNQLSLASVEPSDSAQTNEGNSYEKYIEHADEGNDNECEIHTPGPEMHPLFGYPMYGHSRKTNEDFNKFMKDFYPPDPSSYTRICHNRYKLGRELAQKRKAEMDAKMETSKIKKVSYPSDSVINCAEFLNPMQIASICAERKREILKNQPSTSFSRY